MISSLGVGNVAFAGISRQVIPGRDYSEVGVNFKSRVLANSNLSEDQKISGVRFVEGSKESSKSKSNDEELSEEEEQQVRELKQRDTEVKAHEQAHATVGGSYASAPSYEYTVGPDGKRYATSGEVQIDASPVRDNPEATIRKMDIVIRAALAPAEPSSQDLQVAKQAQATRAKAQAELQKKRLEEQKGDNGENREDTAVRLVAETAYQNADDLILQSIIESKGSGSFFSAII